MPALKMHDRIELTITQVGGLGDGIGTYGDYRVFVPFTCRGDRVCVQINAIHATEIRAQLVEVLDAGLRQNPPCTHFGSCGGCSLQHLRPTDYTALKREAMVAMLRRLHCDNSGLQEMVAPGPGKRRRAEFKISMHKGEVRLGFFTAGTHRLVDITHCEILDPAIMALLPLVRSMIASVKKPGLINAAHITRAQNGFDLMLAGSARLSPADKQKLKELAALSPILRLSEQAANELPQVISAKAPVLAEFAGIEVELPTPAFLQATEEGQAAITEFIVAHMKGRDRVVDLYSGCGTYSFPLQRKGHRVSAYEGSYDMVTAMHNAIRRYGLESSMQAMTRDLFINPVTAEELQKMDGAIINPPRNGAESQSKQLAHSGISAIIMVSCNPATFERDAKHLLKNGYALTALLPIDQFTWSAHLELVAAFSKAVP